MARLLLVEESPTLRYILSKWLLRAGYDVDECADFTNAGVTLATHDAVLIGWPTDITGAANKFLHHLDRYHPKIPVLLLTNVTSEVLLNWSQSHEAAAIVPWETYQEAEDTLELLLDHTELREEHNKGKVSSDVGKGISILFVDDSKSIRKTYQRMLQRHAYSVDTAESVAQAYDLTQKNTYDMVIIDYFMPDANGDELCRLLKENPKTKSIRTAVITGTYLDDVIQTCLEAGAVECMFKNESEQLFLARINSLSRFVRLKNDTQIERERLSAILGSVGEGVYGVDNEGYITFVNNEALDIVGIEYENDVVGRLAHDVFHGKNHDGDLINAKASVLHQAYMQHNSWANLEMSFVRANGSLIPIECSVYPYRVRKQTQGSVVAFKDITKRKKMEAELRWQATRDPLTELLNRRTFETELDKAVHMVRRERDSNSALLYIDLDQFKYLNDTAGHQAGDELLIKVSKLLRKQLRSDDTLARLGGDEFAIILRDVDKKSAVRVADALRQTLEDLVFVTGDKNYNINGSIGIAIIDEHIESSSEVLAFADMACHIAKQSGRNQTHLYRPDQDQKQRLMNQELGWFARIKEALLYDQFSLFYQPIVDIKDVDLNDLPAEDGQLWKSISQKTSIYEVLLRMQGEDGEVISPSMFVGIAERFGLMTEIDYWVLGNSMQVLADIQKNHLDICFSINLSGHTLNEKTALPYVKDLISSFGIKGSSLVFEITESSAIENIDVACEFIDELRRYGCRFALDDFGSGFSSFAQLKRLTADFMKIDGQFVQCMSRDTIDRSIVTAMNDIAHSLSLYTIAEYVESPEVLRLLKVCGVDYVQGHYIAEPMAMIGSGKTEQSQSLKIVHDADSIKFKA